jgi:hypothetical protein
MPSCLITLTRHDGIVLCCNAYDLCGAYAWAMAAIWRHDSAQRRHISAHSRIIASSPNRSQS